MTTKLSNKKESNDNIKDIDVKKLFARYSETKDKHIREELIERHIYIAEILSKKYTNKGIDYDDIYQVACVGLIYAVDRYDLERGYEFSSFATPTIIGEIKKYFRDKGWAIRVPRRIQELSKKINNAKLTLGQKLQKSPTVQDISEYLKCTPEEVLEAMEASKVYTPKSLDLTFDSSGDDKDMNLSQLIGENDVYFDKIENNDFLEQAIKELDEREKKVLKDRYFKNKTQVDISDEMRISQMTVSRIEKNIIKKFRKQFKKIQEV